MVCIKLLLINHSKQHLYMEMRGCHNGGVSKFISHFDFTSDLYSLPPAYTVNLRQYWFHISSIQNSMQLIDQAQVSKLALLY